MATPTPPELVIITMNSGIMVTEAGASAVYTGILTKQDVIDASKQEPYSHHEVSRMMGGSFLDKLKSVAGMLLPKVREFLGKHKEGDSVVNQAANVGHKVLGALGYGQSGGGPSGGARRGRPKSKLEAQLY